jgi:hypothetical protein
MLYRMSRDVHMDGLLRALILPSHYKKEIRSLDKTE